MAALESPEPSTDLMQRLMGVSSFLPSRAKRSVRC